jgi:hypothetical protein
MQQGGRGHRVALIDRLLQVVVFHLLNWSSSGRTHDISPFVIPLSGVFSLSRFVPHALVAWLLA